MSVTCSRCSHVNPADAVFCYFDGVALSNAEATSAPGKFKAPFVLPDGTSCNSFDELALGCANHWTDAVKVIQQGFLQSFLSAMGRIDLAQAANNAAQFPDPDRGLDQFLARLPAPSLKNPLLAVESTTVELPELKVGQDHRFEIKLLNKGMRLLHGSISTDALWLAPSESSRDPKLFKLNTDATIPIFVRGKDLRAGQKPLEGNLIVESNGGTQTIAFKVQVPIVPFGEGVLAGAHSPRQLAEKAKQAPKEAVALFEKGAIEAWYKTNGWAFPVQGPTARGLGAIQQYFEALGLAKAPKVEVVEKSLRLKGKVGELVKASINVQSLEKKPIFASGSSDQAWLVAKRADLNGNKACVPIEITVPAGQSLVKTNVRIRANGQQMFDVPIELTVEAGAPAFVPIEEEETFVAVEETFVPVKEAPKPVAPSERTPYPASKPTSSPQITVAPTPAPPPPPTPAANADAWDTLSSAPAGQVEVRHKLGKSNSYLKHIIPALLLIAAIGGLAIRDARTDSKREAAKIGNEEVSGTKEAPTFSAVVSDDDEEVLKPEDEDVDPLPWVTFQIGKEPFRLGGEYLTFGISTTPSSPFATKKKLFFGDTGSQSCPVFLVDKKMLAFGNRGPEGMDATLREQDKDEYVKKVKGPRGTTSYKLRTREVEWTLNEGVKIVQSLQVVPGQPVKHREVARRRLDNVIVKYTISNEDSKQHLVGVRLLVDTFIGSNDGVPFTIPGRPGLVSTFADFPTSPQVPDFLQALETPNLKSSDSVIAHMTVRMGGGIEPPSRLSLTKWPGKHVGLELPVIPVENFGDDSCVVLYWPEKPLAPGERRVIGFGYGLGTVSSSEGKIGLTLGGTFEPGQTFTATAYIDNPVPRQVATLTVPEGLSLVEGKNVQPVIKGERNTGIVTWKLKVNTTGSFPLKVETSNKLSQTKTLNIFGNEGAGSFSFDFVGNIELSKEFRIVAKVPQAMPGQTLALVLPKQLELKSASRIQALPKAAFGEAAQVEWRVKLIEAGKVPVRIESSTGSNRTKTITLESKGSQIFGGK